MTARTAAGSVRDILVGDLRVRAWSSAKPSTHASADEPVFVLVHGVGMSHYSQLRLQRELATRHRVVSLDLPGFGGAPKPRRDVPVPEMADAIARALRSLGVARAYLVGHSMGVQWATETARRHPDLAAAVALVGPVVDDHHPTVRAQGSALLLDGLKEPPAVSALVAFDYVRCGVPWFAAQVRHMMRYPILRRVADLSVPVLIIRGSRDPIAGVAWAERLAATAARGAAVTIPGQSHHAQLTAPGVVADALRAFVAAEPGETS